MPPVTPTVASSQVGVGVGVGAGAGAGTAGGAGNTIPVARYEEPTAASRAKSQHHHHHHSAHHSAHHSSHHQMHKNSTSRMHDPNFNYAAAAGGTNYGNANYGNTNYGTGTGTSYGTNYANANYANTNTNYKVPPTRPCTPSGMGNNAALRLTMPTLPQRMRSRPGLSGVFAAGGGMGGVGGGGGETQSPPKQRATSPLPATQPRTVVRSVSSSSQAQTQTQVQGSSNSTSNSNNINTPLPSAPKLLRRPKRTRTYGDGTELDGIEDLVADWEKEVRYRVEPKGYGNRVVGGTFRERERKERGKEREKVGDREREKGKEKENKEKEGRGTIRKKVKKDSSGMCLFFLLFGLYKT